MLLLRKATSGTYQDFDRHALFSPGMLSLTLILMAAVTHSFEIPKFQFLDVFFREPP
jgi:hypothetical protein